MEGESTGGGGLEGESRGRVGGRKYGEGWREKVGGRRVEGRK